MICKNCNGHGSVPSKYAIGNKLTETCPDCAGTGREIPKRFLKEGPSNLNTAHLSHDLKPVRTIRCLVVDIDKIDGLQELRDIILADRVGPVLLIASTLESTKGLKDGDIVEVAMQEPTPNHARQWNISERTIRYSPGNTLYGRLPEGVIITEENYERYINFLYKHKRYGYR